MQRLLQQFEVHLSRPERYLIGSDELKSKCLELNQELFSRCNSGRFPAGPLTTLHAKRFDNDQVWEQIQLLNRPTVKYAKKRHKEIGKMTSGYSAVLPQVVVDKDDLNHEQSEMEFLSESSLSSEDSSRRTSASGHDFFSISEMNQFLQEEDRKHESSHDLLPPATVDDFDLFREMSEDEGDQLMYDDFFDPPNDFDHDLHHGDHEIHDIDGSDYEVDSDVDHDLDNDAQHQSTHQRQQQKVTCSKVCQANCSVCHPKCYL